MAIDAVKVSWQGLTNKWGYRWIAQVLTPARDEVLFDCQVGNGSHVHFRKKDALICALKQTQTLEARRNGARSYSHERAKRL